MLAEIGPERFNEIIAYHQLEPWGDEWVRTATLACAVHNAAGNAKVSPMDFLPDQTEREMSGSDLHATAKRIGGVK